MTQDRVAMSSVADYPRWLKGSALVRARPGVLWWPLGGRRRGDGCPRVAWGNARGWLRMIC